MGADEQRVDRAEKRADEARERAEAALRREEETRDVTGDLGGAAPEVDEPEENPPPLRQ
ncbi:MAG: hypothetical protein M3188_08740 [Actinomycetota bacterium]|nr:hypothetical protein [Actinomycetota bacterium]